MNVFKMESIKSSNTNYLIAGVTTDDICNCSNDLDEYILDKLSITDRIDAGYLKHDCSMECGCLNGKLMLCMTGDMTKDNLISSCSKTAGAQSKNQQPIQKKKKSDNSIKINKQLDVMNKKDDVIKKIADYIANTLPKSPLTYTVQDIYRLIMTSPFKEYSLNDNDIKNIIGLASAFYRNKTINHSLLSTININTNDLLQQLKQVYNLSTLVDYDSFLNTLKVSSTEYTDISDCNDYIRFKPNEPSIPSILFALFSTRIPVLFEIVVNQDLFKLQQELQHDDYASYKNIALLMFRLSDREAYYTNQSNGSGIKADVYTELSRILLSMSIKRLVSKIMTGTVTGNTVSPIMNIFKNLYIKNVRSYQEALLSAILKIWSYAPTIVLKNISSDFRTETVFFVEYEISEYNQFENQNIKFSQDLIKYIYYDSNINKVILSPKYILDSISGNTNINNSLPYCNSGIRSINPMTNIALKSTGVFILSIPRLVKRSYSYGLPDEFSDRLINKYVDLDQNITIGCNMFQLRAAVCYKISKYMDLESCIQNPLSLGTVAIVKTQKGWLRYNPDLMYSCNEKKELLDKLLKYEFRKSTNNFPDQEFLDGSFEEWKKSFVGMNNIIDKFERGYINIDALIIQESEAIDIISRFGTLIIYAQEYTSGIDMMPLKRLF
ncbi:P4b precursor [Mythimna separata entomopoxvirus 'L']|uniref:Virion core protein 4b n=1 Tax=Mythimna separata entomopoxvirus 'L' TaxID=1293572 RepID=A0A916KQ75_9POXV|nr:P4b precursor [Mythimna separata entomopoxvirus 'L']CCU56384.1 P4b precursor [Mythimna separata entomopoxvirus 'L']